MNGILSKHNFGMSLLNSMTSRVESGQIKAAILPCKSGDGSSTVVKQLLRSAMKANMRIAIFDFNFQNPANFSEFGADPQDISVFLKKPHTEQVECPKSRIYWLSSINVPDITNLKFGTREMKTALDCFKNNFDLVIIDGPAMLQGNLSELAALCVDQVYLVVRQEITTHFQVIHSVDRLRRLDVEPAGFILNDRRLPIPTAIYNLLFRRRY